MTTDSMATGRTYRTDREAPAGETDSSQTAAGADPPWEKGNEAGPRLRPDENPPRITWETPLITQDFTSSSPESSTRDRSWSLLDDQELLELGTPMTARDLAMLEEPRGASCGSPPRTRWVWSGGRNGDDDSSSEEGAVSYV